MNNNLKQVVYLLILTFTVIVVWVALSVYFRVIQPKSSPDVTRAMKPLPNSFDQEALEGIQERTQIPVSLTDPGVSFEESEQEAYNQEIIVSP